MDNHGLLHAYQLSGRGQGSPIRWEDLDALDPFDGCSWLHFDYTHPDAREWIEEKSGLDPVAIDLLLREETRPRASLLNDGVLIALRGVNPAPDADPEDMVAIRLWVSNHRIISTRRRRLLSANDIVEDIKAGKGPESAGEFVTVLTENLIARMQETIDDAEDSVAELEVKVLDAGSYALRTEISRIRRQTITLRRYLAPQRDAMSQLQNEKIHIFSNDDRLRLRESTDHLMRYIEDLDSIRDRASVTQEELVNRLSEQMNNRMYVLSIVAAIFLPLGFLTGLFGINVGGMPGVENPYAFTIVSVSLTLLVGLQIWLFKRKDWF